jgi:hypothetical protein
MSILDKAIAAVTPPVSDEQRAEAHAKARAAAEPGDWLSLILDHHEGIEAAFAEIKSASGSEERRVAQKKLATLLNGHAMAEEAVIYPALAHAGKLMSAETAYIEQVAAKMQLAALEHLDPLSEDYLDKLGHLEGAVATHVYQEESGWFVDLKEKASVEDQRMATLRYEEEYNRYIDGGPASAGRFREEPRSFGEGAIS